MQSCQWISDAVGPCRRWSMIASVTNGKSDDVVSRRRSTKVSAGCRQACAVERLDHRVWLQSGGVDVPTLFRLLRPRCISSE